MREDDFLQIKKTDLIAVLRDLNTIVVSIDRIGSCAVEMGQEQNEQLLLNFFDQWDVWSRLTEMRSKLSEPFSTELDEGGRDELERELEDTPYWSLANKLPPES